MRSIKTQLVSSFTLVCITCLLITMGISCIVSSKMISSEIEHKYSNQVEKYSTEIDGWLKVQENRINITTNYIENMPTLDNAKILEYLITEFKRNNEISDLYVGFMDKSFLDGSGWVPKADYDCTQRSWFKNAVDKNDVYYGPFFDLTTESMCVSISKPINKDGKIIGVVSLDVNLNVLAEIVKKAENSEGTYGFILDNKNDIIVHPNKDFMPKNEEYKNISDLIGNGFEVAKLIEDTDKSYTTSKVKDYDGVNKYIIFTTIPSTEWKIGIAVNSNTYYASIKILVKLFIIIIILSSIVTYVIGNLLGFKISKPISIVTKELDTIKNLDLVNKDFGVIKSNNKELNTTYKSVKALRKNLTKVVSSLQKTSIMVVEEGTKLSGFVNENIDSISKTSKTISEIAAAVESNAKDSLYGVEQLSKFSVEIESAVENTEVLDKLSRTTTENIYKGIACIDMLSNKIKVTASAQNDATKSVDLLSDKSSSIGDISKTIVDITRQTKLLSLNASIEAARAGEHGKGFAIVANEIKKLSEQTEMSTKSITNIINEIKDEIKTTKYNMDVVEKSTSEYIINMEETKGIFVDINDKISNMMHSISSLVKSMSKVNDNKNEVTKVFGEISAVTEETASSSQEALNAIEVQELNMEKLRELFENLNKITLSLDNIINDFSI